MIAIDTNVLLRYLLADDPAQHNKAVAVIEKQRPVLITDVVLVETVWTLSGKRYGLDKLAILNVIEGLIGDDAFSFENSQVVWSSLMDYQDSKLIRGKQLDFADCLIFHKARYVASDHGQELQDFYSFDKALEQLKGAKTP